MPVIAHNPEGVFPPYRCYSHATEVRGDARLLVISGLNGYEADGVTLPDSFEGQAELIWRHLRTILRAADMDYENLISLRFYLEDPRHDEANVAMRVKHLGAHRPALTVVCCRLLDPRWKLEVEAMAAR
jgi:enamine deaminase RidA (YjgF/YER057c/UK114 family)